MYLHTVHMYEKAYCRKRFRAEEQTNARCGRHRVAVRPRVKSRIKSLILGSVEDGDSLSGRQMTAGENADETTRGGESIFSCRGVG